MWQLASLVPSCSPCGQSWTLPWAVTAPRERETPRERTFQDFTRTTGQERTPSTVAHNCHGKTKNLTAKTKYLTTKPKTSWQNQRPHDQIVQIPHGKSKYPRQNQRYFAFAVKYLVFPWGFWFCREVFCFSREVFWFCREVFCFCREVFGFAVIVVGHHRPRD